MAMACCSCCAFGSKFGNEPRLICMLFLTTGFFIAEIVVGYVTNSVALVADSFHMLSDAISLVVALVAVIYSTKTSEFNTYGWVRAEVLGALANAIFLLALCLNILIEAIQRLVDIEEISQPLLVLGVGSAGLVINVIGLFIFHQHAHGHDHSHGPGHHEQDNERKFSNDTYRTAECSSLSKETETVKLQGTSGSQMNMRGVFLHVLGDALGSVVVIASALIVYFVKDDWRYYCDPVMSIVIAIIIISTTLPLLKQSSKILLQNPPDSIKPGDVIKKIEKVDGVRSIHDLHIWQLSAGKTVASAHIVMHGHHDFMTVAKLLGQLFHEIGIHSVTLQPELCCSGPNASEIIPKTQVYNSPTQNYLEAADEGTVIQNVILSPELLCGVSDTDKTQQSCLLPCVSNDCNQFMCCNSGMERQTRGIVNLNFEAPVDVSV